MAELEDCETNYEFVRLLISEQPTTSRDATTLDHRMEAFLKEQEKQLKQWEELYWAEKKKNEGSSKTNVATTTNGDVERSGTIDRNIGRATNDGEDRDASTVFECAINDDPIDGHDNDAFGVNSTSRINDPERFLESGGAGAGPERSGTVHSGETRRRSVWRT